jgi:ribosomal protein S27AE
MSNQMNTLAIGSKKCGSCGAVKSLDQFHRDRTHTDGRRSKCMECASRYSKIYVQNNRDKVNARLKRWVEANRERAREHSRNYYARNSESHKAYIRRYRKENRQRARAHEQVAYAIKRGTLVRKPCEKCGNTLVEAHHDDYSKPLEVRWLCKIHHEATHHH